MKILFYASHPELPIGYSKIGNILSNYMAKYHDVFYLAISNFKQNNVSRYVHPNIILLDALEMEKSKNTNELYGVNVICDVINDIQPDVVFLYNDIIVINRIFNSIVDRKININFKIWTYIDLVYEYENFNLVQNLNKFSDKIFVFSDCWKKHLVKLNVSDNKIFVLTHGFDSDKFFPINKIVSKQKFGFSPNDFVILNTNRNSYRKGIDKTIDAFILFLKLKNNDPTIKMFLNMDMNGSYDINNLIKTSCIKYHMDHDIVVNNHIFINPNKKFSDEMMNYLYNACDIGINTCFGEGFGLCNFEHAGIGKPQIITATGAFNDIFSNENSMLIQPVVEMYTPTNLDFHGGYLHIAKTEDYADALCKYYDDNTLLINHGVLLSEHILKTYDWDNILKNLKNCHLL